MVTAAVWMHRRRSNTFICFIFVVALACFDAAAPPSLKMFAAKMAISFYFENPSINSLLRYQMSNRLKSSLRSVIYSIAVCYSVSCGWIPICKDRRTRWYGNSLRAKIKSTLKAKSLKDMKKAEMQLLHLKRSE